MGFFEFGDLASFALQGQLRLSGNDVNDFGLFAVDVIMRSLAVILYAPATAAG